MVNMTPPKDEPSDPSLQTFATVTAIVPGERPIVRLSQTLFLPEEQCQTADRGWIGPAEVVHVAQNGGDIDHYVKTADSLVIGQEYPISIDGQWRHRKAVAHYLAAKIFLDILQRRPEDYR
jgi:Ser-tRNA(Ala) deacylase AlaX